jgi:hypothetical protein
LTSTDTTAYAIMHLTGEQARSALMLLASDDEEEVRAAIERAQSARPVHAPLPEAATDPARAAMFAKARAASAERQAMAEWRPSPHLQVVR